MNYKFHVTTALIVTLINLFAPFVFADQQKKPTIAVLLKSGKKVVNPYNEDRFTGRKMPRPYNSRTITQQIGAILLNSGKFRVVDRENITDNINEFELTESQWSSKDFSKIGTLLFADYLMFVTLDRISAQTDETFIKITGENSKNHIISVRLSYVVANTNTGEIVHSDVFTESIESRKLKESADPEIFRNFTIEDYRDLLISYAAKTAGYSVINAMFGGPGTVVITRENVPSLMPSEPEYPEAETPVY